jgi:hypothetical protein
VASPAAAAAAVPAAHPGPAVPHRVTDWPVPRGPRGPDGRWRWTLRTRPAGSFGSASERAAVGQVRQITEVLRGYRLAADCSVRALAAAMDTAPSAVTGMEHGSAWPLFPTVAAAAELFQLRLQLATPCPESLGDFHQLDPVVVDARWRRRGQPAAGWHQLVVEQLAIRLENRGLVGRDGARRVGVDRETLAELTYWPAPENWITVKTVTALAAATGTRLELVPATWPWPA